jgi:hypothetical protein
LEHATSPIAAWESFYVIVGSSAAALTGLQFVVIVLGAEVGALGGAPATRAFATPTIVHFCAVLLVSAILSAPWPSLSSAAVVLGVGGLLGVLYGMRVVTHARRQSVYAPVFEDWLFHGVLPVLAYATLLAAAVVLPGHAAAALFGIAASTILLLLVGIHNAWDAVTYMAFTRTRGPEGKNDPPEVVRPGTDTRSTSGGHRRARSGTNNAR